MRFFTTVNVTDVKVRGTATRGEKIDIQSYRFEGEAKFATGKLIKLLAPTVLSLTECCCFRRDGKTFTK